MPGPSPDNTRQHPRVAPTKVLVRIADSELFRESYLRDLSEGGLYVKTARSLAIGTNTLVELWAPSATEPIELPASVVRLGGPTEPPGVGMKFSDLDPAMAEKLRQLIAAHAAPAESDSLTKAQQLIGDLDEARAQAARFMASEARLRETAASQELRIQELEQDEAALRGVVERVAREKSQIEEQLKREVGDGRKQLEGRTQNLEAERDQARNALAALQRTQAELSTANTDLRAQLAEALEEAVASEHAAAELRAQLATVGAERDAMKVRANEGKATELQRRFEAEQAQTADLQAKIQALTQEVERRRSAERDLRRLLSAMGAASGEELSPPPAPAAKAEAKPLDAKPVEPKPAEPPRTDASAPGAAASPSASGSWAETVDDVNLDDDTAV